MPFIPIFHLIVSIKIIGSSSLIFPSGVLANLLRQFTLNSRTAEITGTTKASSNKMNNALPKILEKTLKYLRNEHPFVGIMKPSVRSDKSSNRPFIGINKPFISNQHYSKQIYGFTLIELVVTMLVAAILITVAVPSMRTFIQNGRINTQINDLIGDLSLARSEAIKRRTNVGVCMSVNGTTCAGGGNWRDGRAIFVDLNNNSTWEAGETILRFREGLASAADTLTTSAELPDPVIFRPNGASSVPLAGPVGLFTFCDARGASHGKQVSLNSLGQTSVLANPPGSC
jgi:type IV fimbrial biogenesis protein FimT